ncbi:hypothetical protein ACKC9G_18405 [Pokkaliibacter sp. CJK22405]|uniref:hypothetical protein n=1 Tax=Pokkaliibacter sp. CJK22405 TaxID=3384615 RepID=UPI003985554E
MPAVAAVNRDGEVTQVTFYSHQTHIDQVQAFDTEQKYYPVAEVLDAKAYRYDPAQDAVILKED